MMPGILLIQTSYLGLLQVKIYCDIDLTYGI